MEPLNLAVAIFCGGCALAALVLAVTSKYGRGLYLFAFLVGLASAAVNVWAGLVL